MKALPGKTSAHLWPEPHSATDKRMDKGVEGARSAIVVIMCTIGLACILVALFMGILEVNTDLGAKGFCSKQGYQRALQYDEGWHCVDLTSNGQVVRILRVPTTALSVQ